MRAISYTIDPAKKLVWVTFPPEIDLAASLATMRRLATDDRMGKGFGVLVDLRASQSIPSASEARTVASLASQRHLFLHNPAEPGDSQGLDVSE